MFQKNILLKKYTSFKIGGSAKYFFEAKNLKELIKAVSEAKLRKIPIFILGGGTKLLVNDKGFKGLVLKLNIQFIKRERDILRVGAGTSITQLLNYSITKNLAGLEWAIGIPGTIGGAVCGNSGAFGHSISEIVKNVTTLNPNDLEIKKYNNKQSKFEYRSSIFKKNKEIILSVEFQFKRGNLKKSLAMIKKYLKRRRERIPAYPSAGSIFKNLILKMQNKKFQKLIPKNKVKGGMVPAAYLIEECGLKDKRLGGAKISEKQANFIININNAKAKDVIALIKLCKKRVKKKFGINLEEEIQILSENPS